MKNVNECFSTKFQQERGFQKQPTIFQNQKRLPGAKKTTLKRYTRTVGLGFRMPAEVRCEVCSKNFALTFINSLDLNPDHLIVFTRFYVFFLSNDTPTNPYFTYYH